MDTVYLFARKFSYIVLNKAVYEKVVEMSTKRRQCLNNSNIFSHIYGKSMMAKYRFNVRDFTKRDYEAYCGMKSGDQDKSWAPHKVCKHCAETLGFWNAKWQTCWCCRDQQRACRMAQASAEKSKHTGPAEKKRVAPVPQGEQLASTPGPPLPKGRGTEPSV